jgi:type II secretory pathway pseudopilin PulG
VKSIPTIAGASKFVVLWRIESRSKGIETLNLGVANCPSPPSGTENHRPIHHKSAGFTLVELLVTAGLICFLTLLIVPALARTKPNNKATECLNNLRQFNAAYSMYASDYQDRVPNNFGVNDILADIQSGTLANWANNVMTWNASGTSVYDQGNTNREWVANGVLGKYLADPLRVYKCPADTFLSPVQVSAGYSARLRSISMNSVLGRFTSGNDSTAQGLNGFFPQYLQYLKQTSVPSRARPGWCWMNIPIPSMMVISLITLRESHGPISRPLITMAHVVLHSPTVIPSSSAGKAEPPSFQFVLHIRNRPLLTSSVASTTPGISNIPATSTPAPASQHLITERTKR